MSLDKQEVLEKLREKYKRAVEKYGEQYFSLLDLETRITHLIKNKACIECKPIVFQEEYQLGLRR